jgi:hypothetical protein
MDNPDISSQQPSHPSLTLHEYNYSSKLPRDEGRPKSDVSTSMVQQAVAEALTQHAINYVARSSSVEEAHAQIGIKRQTNQARNQNRHSRVS